MEDFGGRVVPLQISSSMATIHDMYPSRPENLTTLGRIIQVFRIRWGKLPIADKAMAKCISNIREEILKCSTSLKHIEKDGCTNNFCIWNCQTLFNGRREPFMEDLFDIVRGISQDLGIMVESDPEEQIVKQLII